MVRVEVFSETSPYILKRKINDWLERHLYYTIKQISYAGNDVHWSAMVLYIVE